MLVSTETGANPAAELRARIESTTRRSVSGRKIYHPDIKKEVVKYLEEQQLTHGRPIATACTDIGIPYATAHAWAIKSFRKTTQEIVDRSAIIREGDNKITFDGSSVTTITGPAAIEVFKCYFEKYINKTKKG
jgi:hypothetical protein